LRTALLRYADLLNPPKKVHMISKNFPSIFLVIVWPIFEWRNHLRLLCLL
jgi:hypothetical protein